MQLAPDVAPYFRVLSTMLAAKLTDNESIYAKIRWTSWRNCIELVVAGNIRSAEPVQFKVVGTRLRSQLKNDDATTDDTDYFSSGPIAWRNLCRLLFGLHSQMDM